MCPHRLFLGLSLCLHLAGVLGVPERVRVLFTPTVCQQRCSHGRCTNLCQRGNITSIYSSQENTESSAAFRAFLCPMLCKNGGVCVQKDQCLCPANFTGRFCHVPLSANHASSTDEPEKGVSRDDASQSVTSEHILPLTTPQHSISSPSALVRVRVQHPREASVKIHQVLRVAHLPEAPPPQIQAQTVRGDSVYTDSSGFKYCFREVRDGQCSSPLPGLRSQEMCCRDAGKAWGISECTLCPATPGSSVSGRGSCPQGYERVNGTQCVDVNECSQPGFCENGNCVNTRGSFTCFCREGYLLDASRGICISHKVISEEKEQCFRIVNQASCSLPILRNITKQICCCSRVGKAWGKKCEMCPFFGSALFKEICPAGPGYQYSASTVKLNPRVTQVLENAGPSRSSSSYSQTIRVQQPSVPQQSNSSSFIIITQPNPNLSRGATTSPPARASTRSQTSRPSVKRQQASPVRPVTPQTPRQDARVCEWNPEVCGSGRCFDLSGGRHTCICNTGYLFNSLNGRCQDMNECLLNPRPCSAGHCENTPGSFRCVCPSGFQSNSQQTLCADIDECRLVPNPCINGRCENTPGSFRCVCRIGYKLRDNTCADVDECEDPLQCPGQECVNSQGSYRCVSCRPGFDLLNGQCSDIDECRRTPSPCSEGRCENTPGSFRCSCPRGFQLHRSTCVDVDECEDASQCPGQECVNSQGSYRCVSCRPGFSLLRGRCSDVDECVGTPSPCWNGRCENTPGSFRCVCRSGYRLQGGTCTDVDECEDPSQCPGQECVNSQGSYRCVSCRPGFSLRNGACSDVDECVGTGEACVNGRCENTLGSYRCVCPTGFRLHANHCKDVDECENALQCPGKQCVNAIGSFSCVSCQPGFQLLHGRCQDVDECVRDACSGGQCENTPGSFRCVCGVGFHFQDGACADIDECASSGVCGPQSVCVNTDGSFHCDCSPGFRAAGPRRQCRDVDECVEGDVCFPRGECLNTLGSYVCACSPGYRSGTNGTSCQDVDECTQDGVCQDGRCTNTPGSFLCHCHTGFTTSPEKTACLDVNECVDAVCGSQRCENTIGSFRCVTSCEPGYHLSASGQCTDLDECANQTLCGHHAFCQNLMGTYQCVCDRGYQSGHAHACVDIDECETMLGVCGRARCWNVEGSFTCECETPEEEFDPLTGQCVRRASAGGAGQSGGSSVTPARRGSAGPASGSGPAPGSGEQRECYYGVAGAHTCRVLAQNISLQECCCTAGQAWGLRCQYDLCPQAGTAEFLSLCPSGRGYVTTNTGAFSYKDVDECKLFDTEVCKGGVCVNNIPGYACYCPNGFYHHTELLECIDNNECESEEACPGGTCVNTLGTYFCTCEPPLVLDYTQRKCVNATHPSQDESLNFCWRHVTASLVCQSPMLGVQLSFSECCCVHGEAWGLQCALCPRRDEEAYEALCNELGPPLYSPGYYERLGPAGGGYAPLDYPRPDYLPSDYEDYAPDGRSGLRGSAPHAPHRQPRPGGRYYEEEDYDSAPAPPFSLPEPAVPLQPEGVPLSLAPLPHNSPYSEDQEDEDTWRAPFPSFPRRLYERRYQPYGSLSSEECGILRGCENGRCIRVEEGFTCDCYPGFQLDITSMTCTAQPRPPPLSRRPARV